MNIQDLNSIALRIRQADLLFEHGAFERSYEAARHLLAEVEAVPNPPGAQWRGELLGLLGRCALHLYRPQEALGAIREALRTFRALRNDALNPVVEGLRENLLTALAALDPPESEATSLTHRTLRARIVRAQTLTDRYRFARSIELLEPLRARLHELGGDPPGSEEALEVADARLLYLPRILGLLGFNLFHQGAFEQARLLTEQAATACRALGDHTGERVYQTSLGWIDQYIADDTA